MNRQKNSAGKISWNQYTATVFLRCQLRHIRFEGLISASPAVTFRMTAAGKSTPNDFAKIIDEL